MFIQMSNEQFQKEFASKKLIVINKDDEEEAVTKRQSPRTHEKPEMNIVKRGGKDSERLDLGGLVKIKAYESTMTDELPAVQCNL